MIPTRHRSPRFRGLPALALLSTLSLDAAGCASTTSRELAALEAQVQQLREETATLKQEAAERDRTLRDQSFALQAAFSADLLALRAELLHTKPEEAVAEAKPEAVTVAAAATPPPARKPARRRKEVEAPEKTATADDRATQIRALMAEVASRLQAADDAGAQDEAARSHLQTAQRKLMEADGAAAKDDWDKAESLATEAADLIAGVVGSSGEGR